jgi:predicted dehydrogenase
MGSASEWQSVSNFYQDQAMAGGGVMLDLGCHLLDLALYLFGDLTSIRCLGVEFSDTTVSLENAICAELTFAAGFKGLLRVSRVANLENTIRVIGDCGHVTASLEGTALDVMVLSSALCKGGRLAHLELAKEDPFVLLWRNFHRAIQEGTDVAPDLCYGESGVQIVSVIEQLYRDMR